MARIIRRTITSIFTIMTQQELQAFREIKKRSQSMLSQSKNLVWFYLVCWVLALICIFIFSDNGRWMFWIYTGIGVALAPVFHLAFLGIKLLANLLAIQVLSFQVNNSVKEEKKPEKHVEQPVQPQGTYIGGIKLEDY